MSLIKNLILFCFVISFASSQDFPSVSIYTQQKVEFSLITGQLSEIVRSFKKNFKLNETWYIEEAWTLSSGYLNITNFEFVLDFDENKVVPSEVKDGFYLNCNDSLSITIFATFNAKTGLSTYPKGTVNFKFTTNGMLFVKQIFKNAAQIVENATISTNYAMSWNTDYTSKDDTLTKYFNSVIEKNISVLQNRLTNDLNKEANTWLSNNPKPVTWQVTTYNPENNYTIDMSYWSNPDFALIKDGIIFYHNGVVNLTSPQINKQQIKGFLKNLEVAPKAGFSKWDDFVEADGNHQLFFSANFFGSIINKVAATRALKFRFTQDHLPPNAPYRLDINSLSSIYPGVVRRFAPDAAIYVEVNLQEGAFTQNGQIPKGRYEFLFTVNLAADDTPLLQWRNTLDFTTRFDYEKQILNLFIVNKLLVADTTIISNPYGMIDIVSLDKWIEASFLLFPDWPLLKDGIDLSKEFISSNTKIVADQGVLVYGQYVVVK